MGNTHSSNAQKHLFAFFTRSSMPQDGVYSVKNRVVSQYIHQD